MVGFLILYTTIMNVTACNMMSCNMMDKTVLGTVQLDGHLKSGHTEIQICTFIRISTLLTQITCNGVS